MFLKLIFAAFCVSAISAICDIPRTPAHSSLACNAYGDVTECIMTCDVGYTRLAGEPMSTCNARDGFWAGPFVDCVPIQGACQTPVAPRHSSIDCTVSNDATQCTMTCDEGYHSYDGEEVTSCHTDDGIWLGDLAKCIRCRPLAPPANTEMTCFENHDGDVNCTFNCESWMDMIGPSHTTCSDETGEWTNELLPLCQPNFALCGKKGQPRCPKITHEMVTESEAYISLLSEEAQNIIASIQENYTAVSTIRGLKTYRCVPGMCKIPCLCLNPRKWANKCKFCKVRKVVKCVKGASLFGR